jgi:uncharacterized protein YndB with AHSA1/START domain
LDAPRELVFDMWTDPKHLAHWWGPKGFSITTHDFDMRPGGTWRLVMHGPDGRDYRNHIVYLEVSRPERIVFKHQPEKGTEPVGHQTTVTFAQEGGKTRVTMQLLFASPAAREHVVKTYNAIEGGNQTFDRLVDYVAQAAAAPADLVLTRVFDAPRELVFQAWTEPGRLSRWWGPHGFTNPVCEIDVRPGGAIRIDMRAPNGIVYPMTGVFEEIVPPERLVFRSAALDKDGQPLFQVRNSISFAERGGKTELTLRASVSNVTPAAPPYLAGMEAGWSQSLERLSMEVKP